MGERIYLKCLLCGLNCRSRDDLIEHICVHLSYRKYGCSSCPALFYGMEDRELHCIRTGHMHVYEQKVVPYNELYLNMLAEDAYYAAQYGIDSVIKHRAETSVAPSSSREAGFPWSKLPQELQVKVLRNLQRRDLDTCRLLSQEMLELVRRNEQWMQRRRIEFVSIKEVTWDDPYACELEVECAEEEFSGVGQVIEITVDGNTVAEVKLPQLEIVRKTFRHANIDQLYILQDWHFLWEVLSTMMASGCHVHDMSLRTKSSAPMSSTALGFLRGLDPTVVRIDSVGRWLLDDTTADVLQFIVTRERFELHSVYGDILPVDDNILQLVTASKFTIQAPNLITLEGLKAFVEEVASGKRRVDDCIICTSLSIDGISFPTASNVDVKRINRGYAGIQISRKESEPVVRCAVNKRLTDKPA